MSNLLRIKAQAQRTTSNDPAQKFKFRLTIPGLPTGIGFQKVSGLSHEVNVTEYDESSSDYTYKLAGKEKVGEITAERGVYTDNSFHDLLKETLNSPNMRKTIIFERLNRFGEVIRTYKLAEAWISKWLNVLSLQHLDEIGRAHV